MVPPLDFPFKLSLFSFKSNLWQLNASVLNIENVLWKA